MPAPLPADSGRDPLWRPEQQFSSTQLAAPRRRWLLDDGSLTARLVDLDAGAFSVHRLYQGWQVREVLLRLDGQAVVFARSVFPISSLNGELAHLRKLQHRSLGAILFRYPGMQRSPFELARLSGHSAYMAPWVRQEVPAWARRSCFDIRGKRLLVSEVFLQGFTPWDASLAVHRSRRGTVSAAIHRIKQ